MTVTAFTERTVAWFAALGVRVERVMTDNGSGYVSHRFAGSLEGTGDPAPPNPAVPAPDQREGRAVHSDRPQGVGVPEPPPSARPPSRPSSSVTMNDVNHTAIGDQPPLSRLQEFL